MLNKIYESIIKYIKNNYKSLIILIVFACICFYKLPYVIYAPGGAIDLNDRVDVGNGYESKGKLQMAYVTMMKCNVPLYIASYIFPNWDLYETEKVAYKDMTVDETFEVNKLFMEDGQYNAIKSVYDILGLKVNITNYKLHIIAIDDNADTDLKLLDTILEIDGVGIKDSTKIQSILDGHKKGDVVSVIVIRDNKTLTIQSKLIELEGNIKLGVYLQPTFNYDTDPDISIKNNEHESGSSGGLMTALSIYNKLTKEDITKGKNIIGTGTINANGVVGEIGGVKYKLLGAIKNDADVFICPKENLEEAKKVKKEAKSKIKIISEETLESVIKELEKL